jgi:hypothetical protein
MGHAVDLLNLYDGQITLAFAFLALVFSFLALARQRKHSVKSDALEKEVASIQGEVARRELIRDAREAERLLAFLAASAPNLIEAAERDVVKLKEFEKSLANIPSPRDDKEEEVARSFRRDFLKVKMSSEDALQALRECKQQIREEQERLRSGINRPGSGVSPDASEAAQRASALYERILMSVPAANKEGSTNIENAISVWRETIGHLGGARGS